ncbi:E3 ubiquitin-protein ligase RNF170-like isoform X2 [Lineus longissimus]|uniref:E3 ubiquitin-protein ligase RNF170-like isoform X2 n=1 Tax=Lineus longissimus TaxID=88925 RepID=UPI00315DE5CC
MTNPVTGSLVEGIADDLIVGALLFVVLLAIFIVFIVNVQGSRQQRQIHPESEASVNTTRQRLEQRNLMSRNVRNPGESSTCPVCLGDTSYAVETNCGHVFCGSCITTYWHYGSWLGAIRCPVCRQQVNILLFNFTEQEARTVTNERGEIVQEINNYNRRFSGEPRPWMDYIRDLPTLLRYAGSEFFTWNGLVWVFHARILICCLAALLYFIIPFDIIPEGAFGLIGFFDDMFIVFMLAIYITIIYRRLVEARANNINAANNVRVG